MASQVKRQTEAAFFKPAREFPARDARGFPIGPRAKERAKQNRILNKRLPDSVKLRCEIKLPKCLRTVGLAWAHSKKSRFITTDKDWQEAARACAYCGDALDHKMGHAEMKHRVTDAIKKRKLPE